MKQPGKTARTQPGSGFENALRSCVMSGIVLVDGQSRIATVTREARQILGLSAEDNPEVPVERLPEALVKATDETLASGRPISAREFHSSSQPGAELIYLTAVPLKSISGHSAVVLTLHKLNSSNQFLQQIRHLDRLANAGTLAAGLAHEIKNALVAGRTFLDLLLEKNTDEDLVQIVRRENGRIDAIVTRMLRFAGTTTTTHSVLHLHQVLDHALRLVQPQLRIKSIELEENFTANPDAIQGDEYELQQAFVNLLFNALEAMADKGKLIVGTNTIVEETTGLQQLQITIQDTGSGIAPEYMGHLFEPFFTTKAAGTGLGLAVTQRIIQEHGGSILAESRPGQGTTFSVRLPPLVQRPA